MKPVGVLGIAMMLMRWNEKLFEFVRSNRIQKEDCLAKVKQFDMNGRFVDYLKIYNI